MGVRSCQYVEAVYPAKTSYIDIPTPTCAPRPTCWKTSMWVVHRERGAVGSSWSCSLHVLSVKLEQGPHTERLLASSTCR